MLLDDVRHAWRRLTSRSATVVGAAAMLGLGIGLTVATFSVLDALLFTPIPYHDPAELAQVSMMGRGGGRVAVSPAVFAAWKGGTTAFTAVEAANAVDVTVTTPAGPFVRSSARITPGLFAMLGVKPLRGRLFAPDEGRAGSDDRAIISEDLWRSSFGASTGIIGTNVTVDGRVLQIVGVMPSAVHFPAWNTVLWTPIDFSVLPADAPNERPIAYVRLSPQLPEKDALAVATSLAHGADPSTLKEAATRAALVNRGRNAAKDADLQQAGPLLGGGAALVLLVLCANVGSLLLVRLLARQPELGVCVALGASRGRLLRQTLIEHAMIAGLALTLGLGLANLFLILVRDLLPSAILVRSLNRIDLDSRALWMACSASATCLLLGGVVPAWIGTRGRSNTMNPADRGGTDRRSVRVFTRGLLVVETALSCTLLLVATALVWSFVGIANADRGLDTHNVITSWIVIPDSASKDPVSRRSQIEAVEIAARTLPGIDAVAPSFGLPPGGGGLHFGPWVADDKPVSGNQMVSSFSVGPDFFDLYRLPIVRGRALTAADPPENVIVGQRLARMFWPGQDPIGRTFRQSDSRAQLTVIGVARDIIVPSLDSRVDLPEYYTSFGGDPGGPTRGGWQMMLNIRCAGTCPEPVRIRERLTSAVSGLSVIALAALDDAYDAETARPRATAVVALVFAGIALTTSAGGLFSVLSYVVGRRRREFGVRAALGADARQLRRLVFRDGFVVAGFGSLLGLGGGWMLSRWIESMTYGVRLSDSRVSVLVVGVIVPVVIASCWYPARRAGRADPAALLRQD